MNAATREAQLFEALAGLADTLVADYDLVDMLQRLVESCANLLDVDSAGILLASAEGGLELIASTSDENRIVEAIQIAAQAGPCILCFETSAIVAMADLADAPPEWADFTRACEELGLKAVHAFPMRLRESTIGTLNLLSHEAGVLNERDALAAQALADMATIGILHERAWRAADNVRLQLQNALNSRVVIEQAKGVLAQTHRVSVEEAFLLLRNHARSNQLPLSEVARQLVDRTLIS